jgi:hypothetical protein
MITVNSRLTGLALGLAVIAFASPSFAQRSEIDVYAARQPFMRAASWPVDIRNISGVTWRFISIGPVWLNMAKRNNARLRCALGAIIELPPTLLARADDVSE